MSTTTTCQHEATHIESIDTVSGRSTYPAYVCDYCHDIIDTVDGDEL